MWQAQPGVVAWGDLWKACALQGTNEPGLDPLGLVLKWTAPTLATSCTVCFCASLVWLLLGWGWSRVGPDLLRSPPNSEALFFYLSPLHLNFCFSPSSSGLLLLTVSASSLPYFSIPPQPLSNLPHLLFLSVHPHSFQALPPPPHLSLFAPPLLLGLVLDLTV